MPRARALWVACALAACALSLAPAALAWSPGQLIHLLVTLAEAAAGRPRSNGTGCSGAPLDDAANQLFLELLRNVSDVAVVLDEEGHRPGRRLQAADSDPANGTSQEGGGLLDRSLINATPDLKTCPPGKQRDRLGKCRTAIPTAKVVWTT